MNMHFFVFTLIYLVILFLTLSFFPFVLLQFFMLILLIFLAELAAAILAFIFREHVSFLKSSPHL